MKKGALFLATINLLVVFLFSSCNKKDDTTATPTPTVNYGTFTAKVDGKTFTGTKTVNTLLVYMNDGESRMDVRGYTDTHILVVTLGEFDTDDGITPKAYSFDEDDALLSYYEMTPSGGTISKHIVCEANVTVTSCNQTKKTVTGIFSGKLFDATNSSDTLHVTNGVFTDVPYSIAKM